MNKTLEELREEFLVENCTKWNGNTEQYMIHESARTNLDALIAKAQESQWLPVSETPKPQSLVVYYTGSEYGIIDGSDWDNRDLMTEEEDPVSHYLVLPSPPSTEAIRGTE